MKTILRIAIVDPRDSTRAGLKNMLLGLETVWLEAECSRYDFFTDVLSQTQPEIALISLDSDPPKALALVAKISQDHPTCQTLVVSSSQEGSLILQAMRSGAKEFLAAPLKLDDFIAALDRIKQIHIGKQNDGQVRSSQVIALAGVSGGVGCTSLAINLACSLAQDERNTVAIIDLDLALGDADVWLDIIPDYTIQDVVENITRLDYSLLKRSLTKHDSGVFLLPRPAALEDHNRLNGEQLRRVLSLLKATFTHLLVDLNKNFGPLEMAALKTADSILLVTQLDLPCLRNVVRVMQYFDTEEDVKSKVKIVVNRMGLESNEISLNKALETIGQEIYWQIPNDYMTMVQARNNGSPLSLQAPKAKLTKSIEQLAQSISGNTPVSSTETTESKEGKKRTGLFRFLGSKS